MKRRRGTPTGSTSTPPFSLSLSPSHLFFFFASFPPLFFCRLTSPPQQAFVSYERATGRPRGFGFVVFADPEVAARVVSQAHTIDRREVEAKRAVPKEEGGALVGAAAAEAAPAGPAAAAAAALMLGSAAQQQQRHPQQLLLEQQHLAAVGGSSSPPPPPPFLRQQQQLHSSPPPPAPSSQQATALAASLPSNLDLAAESSGGGGSEGLLSQPLLPPPIQQQQTTTNRKLFVGGLPPSCDDASLRAYFERFGPVDEAVVMVDHESKRSRGCVRFFCLFFFCFFCARKNHDETKSHFSTPPPTSN